MISPYFADTTKSQCISTLEENMFNNARLVWALALLTSFSISCAVADEKTGKKKSGKSIDAEGEIPSTKPVKETVDNEKKEAKAETDEPKIDDEEEAEEEEEEEADPEAKIKV